MVDINEDALEASRAAFNAYPHNILFPDQLSAAVEAYLAALPPDPEIARLEGELRQIRASKDNQKSKAGYADRARRANAAGVEYQKTEIARLEDEVARLRRLVRDAHQKMLTYKATFPGDKELTRLLQAWSEALASPSPDPKDIPDHQFQKEESGTLTSPSTNPWKTYNDQITEAIAAETKRCWRIADVERATATDDRSLNTAWRIARAIREGGRAVISFALAHPWLTFLMFTIGCQTIIYITVIVVAILRGLRP